MFHPGKWAAAYINSLEAEGASYEDGIDILGILASWVKSLPAGMPGGIFGRTAAEKAEEMIREGITEINVSTAACEITIRFLVLMIKKNTVRYIDEVIGETRKLYNKKTGVLSVSAEYALPPDEDLESRIKEAVKKQSGALEVEYSGRVNPDLIGGYRLRIGDELIDASIRLQLQKLKALLIVDGGNQ